MKRSSRSVRRASCIVAALLFAARPALHSAEPADSAADADWDVVKQIHNGSKLHPDLNYTHLHPQPMAGDAVARYRWIFEWFKLAMPVTRTFFDTHPNDPRRWNAIITLRNGYATWANALPSQEPAVIAAVDEIMSPESRAAYMKQLTVWESAMRQASDVAADDRYILDSWDIRNRIASAGSRHAPPGDQEWSDIRKQIQQLAQKYPETKAQGLVKIFQGTRCPYGADPKASRDDLVALAGVPNETMASEAKVALKNIDTANQPLAFTAVDGRKVDLEELKGKVVLIDFWATWCGPCKAELPNVVASYRKYHDRGFAVVGISLENAKLAAGDTPEQTAEKLTAAKKILEDFTQEHDMPWPQFFDGKYWNNSIAGRYSITSIPAMLLLDQDGRLVTTNARGPALEAQLKRLLKL